MINLFKGARLARGLACVVVLTVVAACATTVAINGRFPARYAETTDIRKIAIGGFWGPGGFEFSTALQAELVSAAFDGRSYFTVVDASNRDSNVDPSRATAYGRSVGAQGVISGSVSTQFNTETYQGTATRCVARDGDNKCTKYQTYPIPCWRRTVNVVAVPRLVKVANGQIVYSTQKAASKATSWCQGQSQGISDFTLATDAQGAIIREIRRDIGPYNAVLSATLKTKAVGLPKDTAPQFAAAVKAATNSSMGDACRLWEGVNASSPNNLATVYNLGVCAESEGAYGKALTLYRQAQALANGSDRDAAASIARAEGLLQANGQLAQEEARRAAAERAERDRVAAAAKAERERAAASERAAAGRAAEAGRDRQAAAAAAKAAQDARRRAAIAKYGPEMADAILAGKVKIGMTKEQVIASRGRPAQIRSVGPGEEIWSYGAQRIVFLNGRVSSIR